MPLTCRNALWLLLMPPSALLACSLLTPAGATPTLPPAARVVSPTAPPSTVPSAQPSAPPSAQPSTATATATAAATATETFTASPVASPTATAAPLALEVVQSQTWTDPDGNVRTNFLLRNPYAFPVAPTFRAGASLDNSGGKLIRSSNLYFLDGISGGSGFLLAGETVAANVCYTCETSPLPEAWSTVKFESALADATGKWNYSTDVTATVGDVAFNGDSPIFWVSGSAKNNTAATLSRISVRVFVFDQAGKLAGAAEASAWDVAAGATAPIHSYGIGERPKGSIKYEVTALGVSY